jgi:hypothetical protein
MTSCSAAKLAQLKFFNRYIFAAPVGPQALSRP